MIQLEKVCKTYQVGGQPVHALVDVTEQIHAGEYLALIGRSGSGKSTFLNLLGCLLRPTSGSYILNHQDVGRLSDAELSHIRQSVIGFIFQSFHLVPRLTAAENVELPLVFAGVPPSARRKRVRAALETVGLTDRADHLPSQLSVGQRQRVVIARATIMNPKLILADEPTGNLDRASSVPILDLLDRLHAEGQTVIVVTHALEVARRADRVLVIDDGRIVRRLPSEAMEHDPFFHTVLTQTS